MIALPTLTLRKCSCCYWETRSNVKGQHGYMHPLETIKDKHIYKEREKEKKTLLVGILAVIGRYGPHLMIVNVMIIVTQNNF